MTITIMSKSWQNYLQLHSLLWQTTNPILSTCLHCWDDICHVTSYAAPDCVYGMGRHYKVFIELQLSAIHCYHKPQNYRVCVPPTLPQSSTSNSSSHTFQWLLRYLVIFFGPPHPLCPQPDFFFHCYEKYLYKSLFNVCFWGFFIEAILWLC